MFKHNVIHINRRQEIYIRTNPLDDNSIKWLIESYKNDGIDLDVSTVKTYRKLQ